MFGVVGSGVEPHHLCCRILLSSINHHHIWIKHQLSLSVISCRLFICQAPKIYLLHHQPNRKTNVHEKEACLNSRRLVSFIIFFLINQDRKFKRKIWHQTGSWALLKYFLRYFEQWIIFVVLSKTCNITSVQSDFFPSAKFRSSMPKGIYHSTANEPNRPKMCMRSIYVYIKSL